MVNFELIQNNTRKTKKLSRNQWFLIFAIVAILAVVFYWQVIIRENVEDWLGGLRERERKIIEMRFGLGKYRGTKCTLREIAAQMGVGGARIGQIEAKAKNKLRNIHQSKKMLSSQGLI